VEKREEKYVRIVCMSWKLEGSDGVVWGIYHKGLRVDDLEKQRRM